MYVLEVGVIANMSLLLKASTCANTMIASESFQNFTILYDPHYIPRSNTMSFGLLMLPRLLLAMIEKKIM